MDGFRRRGSARHPPRARARGRAASSGRPAGCRSSPRTRRASTRAGHKASLTRGVRAKTADGPARPPSSRPCRRPATWRDRPRSGCPTEEGRDDRSAPGRRRCSRRERASAPQAWRSGWRRARRGSRSPGRATSSPLIPARRGRACGPSGSPATWHESLSARSVAMPASGITREHCVPFPRHLRHAGLGDVRDITARGPLQPSPM